MRKLGVGSGRDVDLGLGGWRRVGGCFGVQPETRRTGQRERKRAGENGTDWSISARTAGEMLPCSPSSIVEEAGSKGRKEESSSWSPSLDAFVGFCSRRSDEVSSHPALPDFKSTDHPLLLSSIPQSSCPRFVPPFLLLLPPDLLQPLLQLPPSFLQLPPLLFEHVLHDPSWFCRI